MYVVNLILQSFPNSINDTNIIAFGSNVIGLEMAKMIVDEWLSAEFEGGRHQKRIDMIAEIEKINREKE